MIGLMSFENLYNIDLESVNPNASKCFLLDSWAVFNLQETHTNSYHYLLLRLKPTATIIFMPVSRFPLRLFTCVND